MEESKRKQTRVEKKPNPQTKRDQLPEHMLKELEDAFKHYDPEDTGVIQIANLRGILWNFGMWRMSKKEMEEEM